MRRAWLALGLFALMTPVVSALLPVVFAQHIPVTICHRTGSAGNPFVVITTDNSSIIEAHIGPIAHPPKNGNPDFLLAAGSTKEDCREAEEEEEEEEEGEGEGEGEGGE